MTDEELGTKLRTLAHELIERTRDGSLAWSALDYSLPDAAVTVAFQATYKNKTLRLYQYKYREGKEWEEDVGLEVVDERGRAVWEFPRMSELWRLIEAVKFKAAGIEELLV